MTARIIRTHGEALAFTVGMYAMAFLFFFWGDDTFAVLTNSTLRIMGTSFSFALSVTMLGATCWCAVCLRRQIIADVRHWRMMGRI